MSGAPWRRMSARDVEQKYRSALSKAEQARAGLAELHEAGYGDLRAAVGRLDDAEARIRKAYEHQAQVLGFVMRH